MGKYYLLTLGCQMNKNDSERISALLESTGMARTGIPAEADLLLINTCSVRQSAEDRVYGLVYNWQTLRQDKPNLIIGVTGCLPGRDIDGKLKKKLEGVDLFFATGDMIMLPKWINELNPGLFAANAEYGDYLTINPLRETTAQAYITIQTGCNNFCTYCVVPYARGRELNRPVQDIVSEAQKAAAAGCKEIILLGQVVNNYRAPDRNFSDCNPYLNKDVFAALLWELNQISGIERIHFTAADPQYFNDYQIEALTLPKQVNYLHLPAQSGDNDVLKRMNRKYSREYYIDLINKIRVAKPEIAIGTDMIVGFCGETKEQFANSVDFYRQCDFDISYTAMYSARSGTAAAKAFSDDVPQAKKKERWQELQRLMEETVLRKNQKYLGRVVSVLVDKCEEGICSGNSHEMKLVQFPGMPDLIGKIAKIKITRPEMWVLRGSLII